MNHQSAAIVGFIANLLPLYNGEECEGYGCARSLEDGTLVMPQRPAEDDDADEDSDDAWVRVRWQGATQREHVVSGSGIATLAVVRYVQFHQTGHPAERAATELIRMAEHFTFKTGCYLYLPYEHPPRDVVTTVRKALTRVSEKALIELITKGLGL